jgi:DNA-binding CsgD family transcriptional regulator
MDCLAIDDVEQIIHLVAMAGDPTVDIPIPERKRLLVAGVAELVDADMWIWSTTVEDAAVRGDVAPVAIVDGGWKSEQERACFYRFLSGPAARSANEVVLKAASQGHRTMDREFFAEALGSRRLDATFQSVGIGQYLVSYYSLGANAISGIGLYRRVGQPPFTDRDRVTVHVVFDQVDWLHHAGSDVPAANKVLQLSRREREVIVFLLGGDSVKQVARRLELSEHTIGDYVKHIYKRFAVNSRAELLAHFIAGGQR